MHNYMYDKHAPMVILLYENAKFMFTYYRFRGIFLLLLLREKALTCLCDYKKTVGNGVG